MQDCPSCVDDKARLKRGLPMRRQPTSSRPKGETGTGDRFPESQGIPEDVRMIETEDEDMNDWEIATANDLSDLKQCLTLEFLEAQPTQPSTAITGAVDMENFKDGPVITFDSEGYVNNIGASITVKALHFKDKQQKWTRFLRLIHLETIADTIKYVSMATVDEANKLDKLSAIKQIPD